MSTTRLPPKRRLEEHHSGRVWSHLAHDRGVVAERMRSQRGKGRVGSLGRDHRQQLALGGDVQRVDPEDFARAVDFWPCRRRTAAARPQVD